MASQPALRLVDPSTGELHESCPGCVALAAELKTGEQTYRELERKYRGALSQIGNLRADKEAEAQSHKLWPQGVALFMEYRIATDRMGCRWSADRFFVCLPYLRDDGFNMCRFAVWGIAAHPNERQISPSYSEQYNDWELVFRNRGTFERYSNRGRAIFGTELPVEAMMAEIEGRV